MKVVENNFHLTKYMQCRCCSTKLSSDVLTDVRESFKIWPKESQDSVNLVRVHFKVFKWSKGLFVNYVMVSAAEGRGHAKILTRPYGVWGWGRSMNYSYVKVYCDNFSFRPIAIEIWEKLSHPLSHLMTCQVFSNWADWLGPTLSGRV